MMNSNLARSFLKVLIFLSMMNLSSPCGEENPKKKVKAYHCSYCEREFSNYQGLGGHQRAHEDQIKQRFINQMNPVHNSTDITESNPEHGNVSMKTVSAGPTNNPNEMKGNNYDDNGQEDHNSVFMSPNYSSRRTNNAPLVAAAVQTNGTIPFSQFVNHPIHMGSSSNHVGQALYASSASANPQFYANNPHLFMNSFSEPFRSNCPYPAFPINPSLPVYHMTGFGLSDVSTNKFPSSIEYSVVDNQAHFVDPENSYNYNVDHVSQRAKKQKISVDQENFAITSPPTRPNINSGPLEARVVTVFKGEENNASTSKSTNDVKEQEELDLSLHL